MCRFGDGEFLLMDERNIPYQLASKKLSKRLKEILSSNENNILIGIPSILYKSKQALFDWQKVFWRNNAKYCLEKLDKHINFENTYCAAELTLYTSYYKKMNFENYFDKLKSIWTNKDIAVISGDTIFENLQFNIFETAKTIEYQNAPLKNAFDEYDQILEEALKIEKNKLIIIILGPTATVLAYDLALQGYQALDLGHVVKSYDWYKKSIIFDEENVLTFFKPDKKV